MRILTGFLIFICFLNESYSQAITFNGAALTTVSTGGAPTSCNGDYKFKNAGVPSPSISGNCVTLTDGTPANGEGDIWICGALDLTNDFNLTFTANFGSNPNSGDGIAFVLNGNNDAPLGGSGGNIGYEALNDIVAVEFDTWPDADIICHHSEINHNGFSNNLSAPIPLKSCCGSIVDGADYNICVTWEVLSGTTGNLTVTFDGNLVGNYTGDLATLLGNNPSPNWGLTSGCGAGGGQIQTVCNIVMDNLGSTVSSCNTCSPPTVLAIPTSETICSGETTSLSISGSGGTSYCWQAIDNLNVNGETSNSTGEASANFTINETLTNGVPGTQTVTYTVYPESNTGCFGTPLSLMITVLDPGDPACNCPSPYTVSPPSSTPSLCLGLPLVNLTHSTTNSTGIVNDGVSGANGLPPGVSATFSGNATNGIITISGTPTQGGTFNYSIPPTGGCGTETAAGTITVIQTPIADSPVDVSACDSYILPSLTVGNYFSSANGVGPIAAGTTITSTQTIYVYAETGTVPNCSDENSFLVTIASFTAGEEMQSACDSYTWIDGNTYTISNNTAQWVLTNAAGCDSIVTLNLTINPSLSSLTIDNSSVIVIPETCASVNGSITGITSSGGQLPYAYDWNGSSTSSADTSGLGEGIYTLTVTDGNGCSSSAGPIIIGFIDGPSIDPTLINITNEDCFDGNGSITGIAITNGTTPYSYTWNGVVGNLDVTDLTSNDYSLVVTDDNGCTDSYGPISISNSGTPNADFDLSGNPIFLGETLVVTNNSSNGSDTYLWDLGDGTSSTNVDPSITYSAEGSYIICLIASTAANCADTTCQTIEVIEEVESVIGIPNAFSPNNDSHNDVLYVRGSGITSFTLLIYNRYGEKVFETNDLSNGWNGTYKGKPENTGVFAYYLEYEYDNGDKNSLKGNITLVK